MIFGSFVLIMILTFFYNNSGLKSESVSADENNIEYVSEEEELFKNGEYEQVVINLTNKGEIGVLSPPDQKLYAESIFALFESDKLYYVDKVHRKINRDLLTESDKKLISSQVSEYIHTYAYKNNKTKPTPNAPKEKEEKLLVLEETSCMTGSNYTHAKGYVKNNSNTTIYYIEITANFTDDLGNVIDTNYTFGAGGEGLKPNSRKSFEIGVPTNSSITKCKSGITDFQF